MRVRTRSGGPGLEPAGFVVDAVAGEVLFADEAEDPAVGDEGGGVEDAVVDPQREAEGDDHAAGGREDFEEGLEGLAEGVGGLEGVLTSVSGEAELGEAEDRGLLVSGFGDGGEDAPHIPAPVERGLVEDGGGDAEELHDGRSVTPVPGRVAGVLRDASAGVAPWRAALRRTLRRRGRRCAFRLPQFCRAPGRGAFVPGRPAARLRRPIQGCRSRIWRAARRRPSTSSGGAMTST
jgi:hypothetical protein